MTCKLTYSTLQQMYYNAIWAAESYAEVSTETAIRYWKIATYLEKRMWGYEGKNELKSE